MVLARGREVAEALKIAVVTLVEIPPKNVDVIHTIIRRITIRLKPPCLWRRCEILIESA